MVGLSLKYYNLKCLGHLRPQIVGYLKPETRNPKPNKTPMFRVYDCPPSHPRPIKPSLKCSPHLESVMEMRMFFFKWLWGSGLRDLTVAHFSHSITPAKPTLRVQVPKNHILTQNLYYNYYYQNPKYLIIGYMDP